MTETLLWSNPPARVRTEWLNRLAPVMSRPGEWALVRERLSENTARATARDLRNGRLKRPPGQWEFASRLMPGDAYGVWACYVGEG